MSVLLLFRLGDPDLQILYLFLDLGRRRILVVYQTSTQISQSIASKPKSFLITTSPFRLK